MLKYKNRKANAKRYAITHTNTKSNEIIEKMKAEYNGSCRAFKLLLPANATNS